MKLKMTKITEKNESNRFKVRFRLIQSNKIAQSVKLDSVFDCDELFSVTLFVCSFGQQVLFALIFVTNNLNSFYLLKKNDVTFL